MSSAIFSRWFARGRPNGDWREVRRWAEASGHRFAVGRGEVGFAVEVRDGAGCRIEWAPSQRSYIEGQELRVRATVAPGSDLQLLAATRELMTRLERDVYAQVTDGTETRIDEDTPEEMRWVVLYPKMPGHLLGELRTRFGLLSNRPQACTLWLEEGLAAPLASSHAWLEAAQPLAMVVQRGRFTLRMALPQPRLPLIQGALALAQAASAAARRVAGEVSQRKLSSQRPSNWGPVPTLTQEVEQAPEEAR